MRKRGGGEIRGICCSEHVNANPFTLILVTPGTHKTGGEKTRSTKPKRKKAIRGLGLSFVFQINGVWLKKKKESQSGTSAARK